MCSSRELSALCAGLLGDVHDKACPLPHVGLPAVLEQQRQSEGCATALSLNASGTESSHCMAWHVLFTLRLHFT